MCDREFAGSYNRRESPSRILRRLERASLAGENTPNETQNCPRGFARSARARAKTWARGGERDKRTEDDGDVATRVVGEMRQATGPRRSMACIMVDFQRV